MGKIYCLIFAFLYSFNLLAQPVDHDIQINEAAYTQAFLHCVNNEKYFAKYAVESHQSLLEFKEDIYCKLYIPVGLNTLWKNAEKSKVHKKGDFDFKNDFWIGIRFNFYIDGRIVSTAYQIFEKPKNVDTSFSYYFSLSSHNHNGDEGDLNFAYSQLLSQLKPGTHRIYIEAVLPSKDLVKRNYSPIVTGGFILNTNEAVLTKFKEEKQSAENNYNLQEIEKLTPDYNQRLQYLADSTMKTLFGVAGFKKHFEMNCLQNPCTPGYAYANTFYSNKPCTTLPQNQCKEAIISYKYTKKGVPLSIKLLVSIGENNQNIQIENLNLRNSVISLENQNLLSLDELFSKVTLELPSENLTYNAKDYSLSYCHASINQKERFAIDHGKEVDFRIVNVTDAGKTWKNGFVYETKKSETNQNPHLYAFDAATGKLLWVTELIR